MAAPDPYLLDTNIALLCIRGGPCADRIEDAYGIRSSGVRPLICVVSFGELLALSLKWGWGSKKTDLIHKLVEELVVVDINKTEVLRSYAEVDHASEPKGKVLSKNDLWIAATAKATGATLLTTDKDFDCLHPGHINRVYLDPASGKQP